MTRISPSLESNGHESVFCAGLPFVGWRDISPGEKEILNQESRTGYRYTVVWLMLAGLSIVAPLSIAVGLSLVITFSPSVEDVLLVLIVALSLLGFTITLVLADKAFRRSGITKRTLSQGRFRIFKGDFDNEDPTDYERERLVENGVLGPGQTEPITLELHAVDDVIFAKSGSRPRKWIAVELTTAAPLPQHAARFNVPSEWQIPIDGNFERRRMTLNEKEELLDYARHVRRWRWLQIFLGIWLVASLIRIVAKLTGLQTETAIQLGVVLATAGSGLWYYWQGRKARIFDEDAELGWAIVVNAEHASAIVERDRAFTADVEVLATSGLIWIVKGKPAGWRRRRKERFKQ
ncbi:hypothetical protein BH20ACI2_BH20ACI2_16460 [soil metagenome]